METRFDFLVGEMEDRPYTKDQMNDLIYRYFPSYSPESCNWIIGTLKQRQLIAILARGIYIKSKNYFDYDLPISFSKALRTLIKEFPLSEFACLDSSLLNGLSDVLHEDRFILLEVSKRDLFPCYMRLRELTKAEVMLNPNERELSFYLRDNSIILKPLFSKSPCRKNGKFTIEKLIVDCYSDRSITHLYEDSDFQRGFEKIIAQNNVNISMVLNYAGRRKGKDVVLDMLSRSLPQSHKFVLGEGYLYA